MRRARRIFWRANVLMSRADRDWYNAEARHKIDLPWRATRRGAETHQNRNTAAEPAALQCAEDFLQDEYPHEQYKTDPECRRSGFRVSR